MSSGVANNPWQQIGADPLNAALTPQSGAAPSGVNVVLPWENLPNAADYPWTRVGVQGVGVGGYSEWYSDGVYWRPVNGAVVLYEMMSNPLDMVAGNTTEQTLLSYTLPAGLMSTPFSVLKIVMGVDKLNGTADTLTLRVKVASQTLFQTVVATTNITAGHWNEARRMSSTTLRKIGRGAMGDSSSFGGLATSARPSAIVVNSLDDLDNVIEATGQMTTGATEYGSLHKFSVEYLA